MYAEFGTALLFGIILGGWVMYCLQRRRRRKELQKIAGMAEEILEEKRLAAALPGEETLCAKIEYRLVRVQELMQGRRDEAEESRAQIQKLMSEIAHQMRTPLTNAETYLGFLEEYIRELGIADEKLLTYVTAVDTSTEKLHFLVESFIKMSRLEHHIIPIKKEEGDLLKTIRNTLGQVQGQAEAKDIRFEISLPDTAFCMHDPNWLGEAIYNLLDNAVKYSEPGGKVELSVRTSPMFLKLQVRDYGIGIDAGEENLIFRRFYRGKRVTVQEGFGIGLYLAREIVARHGGFLIGKRMDTGLLMELNLPTDVSENLLEVC